MHNTLLILSHLLRYPTEELQQAAPELLMQLECDGVLDDGHIEDLKPLIAAIAEDELLDLQEDYVGVFDRGRGHSLYLFEHVHGESRDRGQAMVDLRSRYEAQGLEIAANELPDYLPLFLEFLSTLPAAEARADLAEPAHIIAELARRLKERATPWAAPMAALSGLAGEGEAGLPIAPADNPDDLAALDAAWAEEQVRFSAPAPAGEAGCPRVADMVASFDAPPVRSASHG